MQVLMVRIGLFLLSAIIFALGLHKEIQKNLSLVYSIEVTARQTKRYIQKMLTYILEVLTLKYLPPQFFRRIASEQKLAPLNEALSLGRGVILLVMHAGNWELFGCALGRCGYRVAAVVNNPRNNRFIAYIDKNRLRCGLEIIDINTQNMYRACLRAFAQNKIVMLAADTGATDSDKNIPLRVLGRELPVATGWATMALRARPLILPIFNYSEKGRHDYVFGQPLDPQDYADEKTLLNAALAFFTEQLRARPFEWLLPASTSEVKKTFRP
ncbi:lysophospholipid acyltransferase superfamily protein [Candidatus Termititenax persephonae]|uniref:Lysophospholipid acyltransferase superfamily protein n=1 Tax=Candidatus Termititenax persephonae TaxID=2218525 RepID=A0A388TG71_9BACT|nr:lysophospholipid acyltransferase superfamily protein [Candidatus Termititenax persephonae]